jgi:hypothetical protein
MSASPDPDPDQSISRTITDLDYRIRDLRGMRLGAVAICLVDLLAGIAFVAPTWNALGSAGPFGLGLVFLDGAQVMIVAIGATSGHRVSSQAVRHMAEMIARNEARNDQLEKTAAERARQIAALTEQIAGLRQILADGADKLHGADELHAQRHHRDTR